MATYPYTLSWLVGRLSKSLLDRPLFPCFLDGKSTSTIPYRCTARRKLAFESGCADGQGPGITQGQPCLLVVELWQAPASSWKAFGCKNRKDPQTVQVWNIPARMGDTKGQQGCRWRDMTNMYLAYTKQMLGICLAYAQHIHFLSKKWFLLDYAMSPALVVNGICHF